MTIAQDMRASIGIDEVGTLGIARGSRAHVRHAQLRAWRRRAQRVVLTHRRVARYVEAVAERVVETRKRPAAQLPSIGVVRNVDVAHTALSKARLARVSSRIVWGLPLWGSKPVWPAACESLLAPPSQSARDCDASSAP
eukprot:scaffold119017_cov81-Phaeocystis_antarctica.AAC.2